MLVLTRPMVAFAHETEMKRWTAQNVFNLNSTERNKYHCFYGAYCIASTRIANEFALLCNLQACHALIKDYHVYSRTQVKKNNSICINLCDFLVKGVSHYIWIHYERSQSTNLHFISINMVSTVFEHLHVCLSLVHIRKEIVYIYIYITTVGTDF